MRAVVVILVDEYTHSVVSVGQIAGLSRTACYRAPQVVNDADAPSIAALTTLIAPEGRWNSESVAIGRVRSTIAGTTSPSIACIAPSKLNQVLRRKSGSSRECRCRCRRWRS